MNDISLIPSFMLKFLDALATRKANLGSLTFVRSGASHFPPELQVRIARAVSHAQLSDGEMTRRYPLCSMVSNVNA